jgi:class 3 adenylate cyclase
MSKPTTVITRNLVAEYHLLGLLLIIIYLVIGLSSETFWEFLPVLITSGLCLVAAELVFHFKRPKWGNSAYILNSQKQQIAFDLSPYIFTIMVVLLMETYLLNHPLDVVAKSVLAILCIGFYISMAIALEVEFGCVKNNLNINVTNITQIVPAGVKFNYFQLVILTVDLLIFVLACFEHIFSEFWFHVPTNDFIEILFVGCVVISFSAYLYYLQNRNFLFVLGIQVNSLRRVEEGNYEVSIPIISNDELALLAGYHNAMIERLRDRERLYRTLEKSVGANIMEKLLTTDEQTLKQGQSYSVAILFCDLRGFTSLGESASAEEIILFLNVYFSDVSSVISEYNGFINKFMGDAVLAIFGLEGNSNAVEDAVNAALVIIQHSVDFFMPNAMHPETGVGIDFGSVIGGTIGSDERYEYTIIGDAVNRANRLESLSKRLGYGIILSDDAYKRLPNDMRNIFSDLGDHKVRGRNEPISIYGYGKKSKAE